MGLLGRILFAVATVAVVGAALAHAQGVPDGPTAVVMQPAAANDGWANTVGDVSWAAAGLGAIHRFLAVLERIVTDTRGWLDRWLDKTGGKIKIDFKRTGVTIPWSETDPDRTGPIPHNRRSTDGGRNGGGVEPFDDSDH